MTGKQRLECLLNGQVPDVPPHWELVFQIEKEMFGMDPTAVADHDQGAFQVEVFHRLIDEMGWAAVGGHWETAQIDRCRKALGHMDIKQVREKYPDWILMGNVACNMLQDADEARIRESVRYCMTHGGIGKPYIFSTSNCIFNGMPPESYRIMIDEYQKQCQ